MERVHLNWIENADRSEKLDFILFFAALACCCLVLYILAFDISLFTKPQLDFRQTDEPLATIVTSENTVSYKNSGLPFWNSTSNHQQLYLNDQIFTDSDSWAQIAFANDVRINVGQNSLIVILQSEKQSAIKLEQGTLYVNFDSPGDVTVNLGSGDIRLSSTNRASVELNARKDGTTSIASITGKVKVSNRNNNIEFGKNKSTVIDSRGQLGPAVDIPIFGLTPEHDAYIRSDKIGDTLFAWQVEEGLTELNFEIAHDQNFKEIVPVSIKSSGSPLASKLKEGQYYWRVKGRSANGKLNQSSTYKITVVSPSPPKAIYPSENQVFEIQNQTAIENSVSKSVFFDWQRTFAAMGYEFQLSSDPSFQKILKTSSSTTSPLAIHALQPADYYWRVRTKYNKLPTDWSRPNHFKIQIYNPASAVPEHNTEPKETLAPPKLQIEYHIRPTSPKPKEIHKKEHTFLFDLFVPTAYADDTSQNSEISWPPIEGAASYDLQLSRDEKFMDILVEKNVLNPSFALNKLKNGKYFLRIRTVGVNGAKSPFSDVSVVYVVHADLKLISPEDGSNQTRKNKIHPVSFEWQPIPEAETYIFELSNSDSFKKPLIHLILQDHKTTRTFSKPGTYYWRIGYTLTGDGEFEYSQINSFSLSEFGVKPPVLVKSFVVQSPPLSGTQMQKMPKTDKPLQFPIIKFKKDYRLLVQAKWMASKFESLSSLDYGKEKLKVTSLKSAAFHVQYWPHKNYGLSVDLAILKSEILKNQSLTSKSSKLVIEGRFKPNFFAETSISLRAGVAEKYIIGLAQQSSETTLIKTKKINGALIGMSYRRALSENYGVSGVVDYFHGTSSILSTEPYHFDTKISFNRYFDSKTSIGIGYLSEFGQYRLKPDNTELEIYKLTTRQQQIAVLFGWMM